MGSLKKTAATAYFFIVLSILTLVTSTFAWFTFRAYSTADQIAGTVGEGAELLIANNVAGPFGRTCELILSNEEAVLTPITTSDLTNFYLSLDSELTYVTKYKKAEAEVNDYIMNGKVYLKSSGDQIHVFLWPSYISASDDPQVLASLRLGIQINLNDEKITYIFRLDELGDTSQVETMITTTQSNSVVSAVTEDGEPIYVEDPSKSISLYSALGNEDAPIVGENELFLLPENEIAEVEYWLYLEGCDENCLLETRGKEIQFTLGFAGVPEDDYS